MSYIVEVVGWAFIGIIIIKLLYTIYRFIYTTYIARWFGLGVKLRDYGPWAAVTGATDGIGKSYAKRLGEAGLNLVLISRTQSKLDDVAKEIGTLYPNITIKTIAVDFTEGQSIYPALQTELDSLEIGILINAVGMLFGFAKPFLECGTDKEVHDLINCNIMSIVRMNRIVLPQMVKRKKGIVVNIGSISSAVPSPFLALYAASKTFIDKFSQDLAAEVRSSGIIMQTLHPGFVVTKMVSFTEKPAFKQPAAPVEDFVKQAIATIGIESRSAGWWAHHLQLMFIDAANAVFPRKFMEEKSIQFMREIDEIISAKDKTS